MKKKILFVVMHDSGFIKPIIKRLEGRYDVKTFQGGSVQEMFELMKWADTAWFEWCDDAIVQGSRLPKVCKMICRLHRYEVYTDMPGQVAWDFVDRLVLVSQPMKELFEHKYPVKVDKRVINNALDLEKFEVTEPQGNNIAYIGYLNNRKNIGLALQILAELPKHTLHVAGEWQHPELKDYTEYLIEELGLDVRLHGFVKDIAGFLKHKKALLSTSTHESFGYGIFEAMAAGVKPVVHNFPGAKQLYPEICLFNTVSEAVDSINAKMTLNWPSIVKPYSRDKQIKEIEEIL